MQQLTLSDFKRAILTQHGAHARILAAENALLPGEEEPQQELRVLIFELIDHPTARRCYAWEQDGYAVAVLHSPWVNTPQAAVRSALEPNS